MKEAMSLLTDLIDSDVDWLCSRGHERRHAFVRAMRGVNLFDLFCRAEGKK